MTFTTGKNNFDRILRKKRIKLKLLAKATGLNLTYLTNIRSGKKDNFTLRVAFKISRVLEESVEDLFGDMINVGKLKKLPTGKDGLTLTERLALKKQQRNASNQDTV